MSIYLAPDAHPQIPWPALAERGAVVLLAEPQPSLSRPVPAYSAPAAPGGSASTHANETPDPTAA